MNQRQGAALVRVNIWIVLIVVISLFAVTRLLRYYQDTHRARIPVGNERTASLV